MEEIKVYEFSVNWKIQIKILGYHCPALLYSFLLVLALPPNILCLFHQLQAPGYSMQQTPRLQTVLLSGGIQA